MSPVPQPHIRFEDQHLCVLEKPAGLLSQGAAPNDENLVDWLREHFGRNYVGLVHRLDRNTSGLMVVAKRTKSASRLSEQLRAGKLLRRYLGLLCGRLSTEEAWNHFLAKDSDENLASVVAEGTPGARRAELVARPLEYWQGPGGGYLTLAHFTLETGRSHQIRVQAAAQGIPLLGDRKYGSLTLDLTVDRPALHSAELEFHHPMSGELLTFHSPFPHEFVQQLENHRWKRVS